ncbi:N,N'-diacetylbacillosaminyl-diphospho-undecaprenol alpha-1,3-N-acetylgalactosaminyltransferase [Campylobacter corcagiensis]|uniref:N, N'-diacetylbacillosaminyl-diphospho-undecaprenol alpha-1,3-N-acetylgalactosaminyltransferase n=1 Tax=Campylobacter corcagiensis TaxID=1448857 RepID=A0A7M1LI17_9BACT|nr:N,N'-diacetylbacillosaminyl-diphospho-undecaprenol alpha-1,3-N-acetylgalactosaminyltransferase [Campylobacter corcagiensis]QKF64181.1 N,N'-diacetylbacillosaminyl-diphospho-undecaprenol alpha-1,3-N-acetylgalactosaminyltransferase [Campylobacter corcagiensis]QOQ87624.1 N,N'-diacetylbacillosaminyl-diphospho-undecaprenol alpha-1,3-N-acetylgalactosaminyltransferase [Campylobacter corcagiensis]
MARIGFLSHSDMSLYYFRKPIMKELKNLGHEIFAISPKGEFSKLLEDEFNVINYEIKAGSINPFRVISDFNSLKDALRDLNLDMLQTAAHKSNTFGTFAAKSVGIKNVINLVEGLGSFYVEDNFKSLAIRFILNRLNKKAFRLSDKTIFVNDSDPDYMIKKGIIKENKVVRIKSVGVDASYFDPESATPYPFNTDKKVVMMIGRALWHKGIREFYQAAEILKDRKDVLFVFVGDVYEGNKSSAGSDFLLGKNVLWIRWSDKIKELLKASYLYALPSYKEGFPRTVLEAMSMAKPCVVSDVSGCNEAIKDGFNGLLCKPMDSKDLATKIAMLLNDDEMALEFGRNGRNLVIKNYNQPIITKKYLEVYKEFIDV